MQHHTTFLSTGIPEVCPSSHRRSAVARRLGLVVLAICCLLPACKKNSTASPTGPSDPGSQSFGFLAGTWVGTWTDTRYNVSGTLQATFTVSGSTITATGVIGLASLGLGNEPGSGNGTVSGQTLTFTFTSSTVGTGSGSLNSNEASPQTDQ